MLKDRRESLCRILNKIASMALVGKPQCALDYGDGRFPGFTDGTKETRF
jgi:hypothetical protein